MWRRGGHTRTHTQSERERERERVCAGLVDKHFITILLQQVEKLTPKESQCPTFNPVGDLRALTVPSAAAWQSETKI